MCSRHMCDPTGACYRISQESQGGGGIPNIFPPESLPLPFPIYPLHSATYLGYLAESGTSLRDLDSPHIALKSLNNKSHCSWSSPRNFWVFLMHPGFSMLALWMSLLLIESPLCFLGKPHSLAFMTEVPGEESDK